MTDSLKLERSGLTPYADEAITFQTHVGAVDGLQDIKLPANLERFDCRSSRLAELALRQDGFDEKVGFLRRKHGPSRIGVFVGTTTAGISETEQAYRRRDECGHLPVEFDYAATHNFFSVADYVRQRLSLDGPSAAIACACASSSKAFATGRRMISAGIIDAAVVGGVDSLCLTTLYGFQALQLCATTPCRPFDRLRDGLSLGEAAAFILMQPAKEPFARGDLLLLGIGESSDAHHMSAPHPGGKGAQRAIRCALIDAGLEATSIDYINLHGTGTPLNDRAEGMAVSAIFGPETPCSSTKGSTGHTLGASGALECVIAGLALQFGFIPGGLPTLAVDRELGANYVTRMRPSTLRYVLSNAFGFGGANCSLVLGMAH